MLLQRIKGKANGQPAPKADEVPVQPALNVAEMSWDVFQISPSSLSSHRCRWRLRVVRMDCRVEESNSGDGAARKRNVVLKLTWIYISPNQAIRVIPSFTSIQ